MLVTRSGLVFGVLLMTHNIYYGKSNHDPQPTGASGDAVPDVLVSAENVEQRR